MFRSFAFYTSLILSLFCSAQALPPEKKSGYEKSRDVRLAPPNGSIILFDGTRASLDKNWQMWPDAKMEITWKFIDSLDGSEKFYERTVGKSGAHMI